MDPLVSTIELSFGLDLNQALGDGSQQIEDDQLVLVAVGHQEDVEVLELLHHDHLVVEGEYLSCG